MAPDALLPTLSLMLMRMSSAETPWLVFAILLSLI
jgi:hypothetical protein